MKPGCGICPLQPVMLVLIAGAGQWLLYHPHPLQHRPGDSPTLYFVFSLTLPVLPGASAVTAWPVWNHFKRTDAFLGCQSLSGAVFPCSFVLLQPSTAISWAFGLLLPRGELPPGRICSWNVTKNLWFPLRDSTITFKKKKKSIFKIVISSQIVWEFVLFLGVLELCFL